MVLYLDDLAKQQDSVVPSGPSKAEFGFDRSPSAQPAAQPAALLQLLTLFSATSGPNPGSPHFKNGGTSKKAAPQRRWRIWGKTIPNTPGPIRPMSTGLEHLPVRAWIDPYIQPTPRLIYIIRSAGSARSALLRLPVSFLSCRLGVPDGRFLARSAVRDRCQWNHSSLARSAPSTERPGTPT